MLKRKKTKEELSFEEKNKEKIKKVKKNKKDIIKTCKELIPIRAYDEELEAFLMAENRYMDIFKIITRDTENMSDDEISMEIINLIKILKTIAVDIKFISMNFPLNTTKQREVFEMAKDRAKDYVRVKWIDRQIDELERADSGVLTREFYLFIFSENKKDFMIGKENILKYTASGYLKLTDTISSKEKINILSKLSNMNTKTDLLEDVDMSEEIIEDKKDGVIDISLFSKIQPKGGISFKEPSFISFGDGYARCLHVYNLPAYVHEFWLSRIFNLPGCICTLDISTKDIAEVKKNINKSLAEEQARGATAKHHDEVYDSVKRQEELQLLYDEIQRFGEVIKLCDFRIFVTSRKLSELEEVTDEIVKNLEADSYKVTTLLNEQKSEFLSLYEPYQKTHKRAFTMQGLTLTSEQLASGFPFSFSQLIDDEGFLLGFTKTGGVVVYDPFCKTEARKHYNALVSGDMGSGKSTHLKKLFKYMASIGGYIRVFDISGEFTGLTEEFGGKIIKCNGADGILNPLEILKAGEDDYVSYSNHISKLLSFFKCIIPSMSDNEKQELSNEFQRFYSIYNLTPGEDNSITGRNADEYPTLSNFKEYLKKSIEIINELDKKAITEVQTSLNIVKAKNLNNILLAVDNLVSNYGNLFDGHSTINDITKEKIVSFDISSIKDLGSIFTAQMQNLASLCWDNAVANGQKMKDLWEDGEIASYDITKFLILIDESHRWVNTSMPAILDMIIKYMREARKYFTGIVLASQSIRDFMPEATAKDLEKIRVLFELSQYKFMFKQDSSAKEHIRKIFGYNMSDSQVERIPFLKAGECILSISGDKSIEFKEWLSKEYEEQLFAGGR